MSDSDNAYTRLYHQRMAEATRVFYARGKSVVRCERCMLADYACICPWRQTLHSHCEFVLLMHRDEVFKPTNTGRLVADTFPGQTHAFAWHRTEPPAELITLLRDPNRLCMVLYPAEADETGREIFSTPPTTSRQITFILLDGTWKQARRMLHLSRWLDGVPCLSLPSESLRSYAVRKSSSEERLSTAETAALCLEATGEQQNADLLSHYFTVFNHHYLATRGCFTPQSLPSHHALAEANRQT